MDSSATLAALICSHASPRRCCCSASHWRVAASRLLVPKRALALPSLVQNACQRSSNPAAPAAWASAAAISSWPRARSVTAVLASSAWDTSRSLGHSVSARPRASSSAAALALSKPQACQTSASTAAWLPRPSK